MTVSRAAELVAEELRTARRSARAEGGSGSAGCGAELLPRMRRGRAPHRMEQSIHPPLAAAERAALRTARRSARAEGGSGSAGWGAELLPRMRRGRAPHRMEQSFQTPLAAAERAELRGPG
jgi:hypothetical protein